MKVLARPVRPGLRTFWRSATQAFCAPSATFCDASLPSTMLWQVEQATPSRPSAAYFARCAVGLSAG
ncbi:hypothetical protein AUC71_01845 [Methyloceanibacter marginalis]|uniref:Uncharacterized protein n=1 Tax=Methyloceanibacter marginalis TaxID=1774971 RepID=A0A1E3W962_9HYPH|nr:hypothetical protein AUC71_01845 [Methyloceanibacter marginalis]